MHNQIVAVALAISFTLLSRSVEAQVTMKDYLRFQRALHSCQEQCSVLAHQEAESRIIGGRLLNSAEFWRVFLDLYTQCANLVCKPIDDEFHSRAMNPTGDIADF